MELNQVFFDLAGQPMVFFFFVSVHPAPGG